nr:hypothetical protein [Dyella sp. ASV24]
MHATYRSHPGLGATSAPAVDARAKKFDRLDLLARTICLSDRSVALALSQSDNSARNRSGWNDLFDQAEMLGRQWATTDPIDARRLLPSLLTGVPGIAERFEHGYTDVVCLDDQDVEGYPRRREQAHMLIPLDRICDACDTNVTILLNDLDADDPSLACPCCGQHWEP